MIQSWPAKLAFPEVEVPVGNVIAKQKWASPRSTGGVHDGRCAVCLALFVAVRHEEEHPALPPPRLCGLPASLVGSRRRSSRRQAASLAAACHLLRRTHRATEQHVIARRQFGALLHADEVVALLQDCASYPCCSS